MGKLTEASLDVALWCMRKRRLGLSLLVSVLALRSAMEARDDRSRASSYCWPLLIGMRELAGALLDAALWCMRRRGVGLSLHLYDVFRIAAHIAV